MQVWGDVMAPDSGLSVCGEFRLVPDMATLKPCPWHPAHAQAMCFLHAPGGTAPPHHRTSPLLSTPILPPNPPRNPYRNPPPPLPAGTCSLLPMKATPQLPQLSGIKAESSPWPLTASPFPPPSPRPDPPPPVPLPRPAQPHRVYPM